MINNNNWFVQLPSSLEGSNVPKFEYIPISETYAIIKAPQKKKFYKIYADSEEKARDILKNIANVKFIKAEDNHLYSKTPEIEIYDTEKISSLKISLVPIFSDQNHIFYGDQYIGHDFLDFLERPYFVFDFFSMYDAKIEKMCARRATFFSDDDVDVEISQDELNIIKKNVRNAFRKSFSEEFLIASQIIKNKDKNYLFLKFKSDPEKNVYYLKNRIFIFELNEFIKNGRIVEDDLEDKTLKIRSQISHLSLDRHDSIAF